MKVNVTVGKIETIKTPALAVGVFENAGVEARRLSALDAALGGLIGDLLKSREFVGKPKTSVVLHPQGRIAAERVILVGLGERESFTPQRLREAAAKAARVARSLRKRALVFGSPCAMEALKEGELIAEGVSLGLYEFRCYRAADEELSSPIDRLTLTVNKADRGRDLQKGAGPGLIIGEATNACRDLVNTPSNDLTPSKLAERARALCKGTGVRVEVWDKKRIVRERMGALLAVAQGSAQEPRFIILKHQPAGAKGKPIALVGKAVTFDSGGVSLKTGAGMMDMKCDMAGGGAVIATLAACGRLKIPRHVLGFVPATENMPSGSSIKPGDVVRARNGKTIEILNTDAEGRLILSDALVVASEHKPQAIIDLATLTGACVVALGDIASGMMGNDEALQQRLRAAADASGDRVWPLPLWDEYMEHVKSKVAEIKNVGKNREAGAIAGAAFLKHFVGAGIPWAHLDIAGPAFIEEARPLHPYGATGCGVRLLIEALRNW